MLWRYDHCSRRGTFYMKLIPLSQTNHCKNKALNLFAQVDDEDYEYLMKWNWQAHKNKKTFYAERKQVASSVKRIVILMHREISKTPVNLICDHIDHNGLNNQKNNLRNCTVWQNNFNTKKREMSSSKFLGVSWLKKDKKWKAVITFNKKQINLGRYDCEETAAMAYDVKALELYGEFANLNFK